MLNVVHVTHEAVQKIGGIGSVLEGLITSPEYANAVERTILLAPLFTTAGSVESRLGPEGEVLYSSVDGRRDHALAGAFREIEDKHHVGIVYGRRLYHNPLTGEQQRPEIVLIDVNRAAPQAVNGLKHRLYESFGIASDRYEHSWEFEQYVRLAEPGLAAMRALGVISGQADCFVVAHEFMGLPTAFAAKLWHHPRIRTVFYAHETAPIRKIVEEHAGHDVTFYNVLRKAKERGLFIEDVFGNQHGYFKHALVEATHHLDVTLAVGDHVVDELRFLSPAMTRSNIRLTYNGIPAYELSLAESQASKARLQDYVETLLGFRPDHVFTHVTRMAISKGLWRDIWVMEELDRAFLADGRTGILIVLSTEMGGPRRHEDVLHMEKWWDWPVAHREGLPDLSGGEALFYAGVQAFNARSRSCKILFINQFGFDRFHCGNRMPANMSFWDIRKGSDVEFGQSIYEPFGIAQLEALSFGAVCVMTNVCGCAGFVQRVAGREASPNVVVADYTDLRVADDAIEAYLRLSRVQREAHARKVAHAIAGKVLDRLPRDPAAKAELLRHGSDLAHRMSWDVVARDFVLPAFRELTERSAASNVA